MKVEVKKMVGKNYAVELTQGVQHFYLDLGWTRTADKAHCEYMAKMFKKALRNHNKELTKQE